jgi:RNA polymerase sigma factor (TIGR02999 family)
MPVQETITGLLQGWNRGDAAALEKLAPIVQSELRGIARRLLNGERAGAFLQPTEVVHDAYLRLLDWPSARWQNRAHFFATAARMMRRSLVDAARARQSLKRAAEIVPLDDHEVVAAARRLDILRLDDALEGLAVDCPRAAQVIELRFFGGFTNDETAEALGVSVRTVINDWNTARAWLYRELTRGASDAR